MSVIGFIAQVRESHASMVDIFTRGSCFRFYVILRSVFPGAVAYYDNDHIVTRIGDRYYDIRGDVTLEVLRSGKFSPFMGWFPRRGTRRAVSQMTRRLTSGVKHR